MFVIMNASEQVQSHSTGLSVHLAADDCARHACMVTSLNSQYHQYLQSTPLMREFRGCPPLQVAKAVVSIRVGNRLGGRAYLQEVRHGGRANRQEVITSVISRPLRVPSPVNRQTGEVGVFPRYAIQTDRVATGGERWRSMHPPPWPHQSAGKVPTNPT